MISAVEFEEEGALKADPVALPADSASSSAKRSHGALPAGRALLEASRYWGARVGLLKEHEPRPFVIATGPRMGSTALQRALNSHPNIVCMHELMDCNLTSPRYARRLLGRRRYLSRLREQAPDRFLEEVLLGKQPRCVLAQGFKAIWMHPHGDRKERLAHWRRLQSIGSLQVVWLSRPRLESILSFVVARASGGWIARGAPIEPIRVNPDYLIKRLAVEELHETHAREVLASNSSLEIEHASLRLAPVSCLRRVQAFLGVPECPIALPDQPLRAPNYTYAIKNWPDVAAALRATRWEAELASFDPVGGEDADVR